jgi:hypothetical protein
MVRMEMCDDDIRQIIEVNASLFKPNHGIADTINQKHAFLPHDNQVGVLMVFGWDCVG